MKKGQKQKLNKNDCRIINTEIVNMCIICFNVLEITCMFFPQNDWQKDRRKTGIDIVPGQMK